ncbi:DUF502 domain-containing protein [Halosimplex salinum]|uniref:DUF502 domain-containing protein n=1 Tax=Halosimplex salinum TaxID=1710538 RepID=UPI000F49BDA7|nr:DUF502 domain-containing protein [Halosimplex salinum]
MVVLSAGPAPDAGDPRTALSAKVRQVFLTGAALTIPLLVTVMILAFVVNFILRAISPVVTFLGTEFGLGTDLPSYVMELLAVFTLVALIFAVGLVAENRSGDGFQRVFDTAMSRIPGIGSVYTSFNEMTELLLSNDTQSFREVKLVEFPTEGSYSIAFVTADPPPTIDETTGHDDVTTLFMPLAPNPVMGGYVVHVSADRVYDVDMTVEEGVRSLVTSGVATGDSGADAPDGELVDFDAIRKQARGGVEGLGAWGTRTVDDLSDFTGDAAEDIRKQAYREFAAIHPDLDESEVEDEKAVRHYMLDQTELGDTESGAEAEVNAEAEQPGEGSSAADAATDGDAAGGDA